MEQVERVLQLVRESLAVPSEGDARVSFFLHGLNELLQAEGATLLRARSLGIPRCPPSPMATVGKVPAEVQQEASRLLTVVDRHNGHSNGARIVSNTPPHTALSARGSRASQDQQGLLVVRGSQAPSFKDEDRKLLAAIHGQCHFLLGNGSESHASHLTARQREVAGLLCKGLSEQAIAHQLFISPHTVHSHVKSIYSILNVSSRVQLNARINGSNAP
ncbi:MAG: helix-turn-helix transcriptional regulator [Phycisphaeraceae bacterium]